MDELMTNQRAFSKQSSLATSEKIEKIMETLSIQEDKPLNQYDLISIISELTKLPRADINRIFSVLMDVCNYQLHTIGEFEVHGLAKFKLVPIKKREGKIHLTEDGVVVNVRPKSPTSAIRVTRSQQTKR